MNKKIKNNTCFEISVRNTELPVESFIFDAQHKE